MGHHYVPQAYLRGFSDPSDTRMIWMYDKKESRFVRASIKSVAQEPAYYSEDDERQLNELVERPANVVLQRLRAGDYSMPSSDRAALALYMATMIMRVPHRRRKAMELHPRVLQDTVNELAAQIAQWAQTEPTTDPELVSRRLAELERARDRFAKEIPRELSDSVRNPWPTQNVLRCVSLMSWRILPATRDTGFFLTSDNPAFFFGGYGLGNRESELTFPLASDMALLASWQGAPSETLVVGGKPGLVRQFVREVNRRVAFGAERFVFYHADEDWVPKVAAKRDPFLSRILR